MKLCSVEWCGRKFAAKGMCQYHWRLARDGKEMREPKKPPRWAGRECSVVTCDRQVVARGFCAVHWRRDRSGKDLNAPIKTFNPGATCGSDGCDKPVQARGMCCKHYESFMYANDEAYRERKKQYGRTRKRWVPSQESVEKRRVYQKAYDKMPHRAEARRARVRVATAKLVTLKKKRDSHRKYMYGLTAEQLLEIYEAQDRRCAICGGVGDFYEMSVDHCHATGVVRGFLCGGHNRAIGLLGDSPQFCLAAAEYLERSMDVAAEHDYVW